MDIREVLESILLKLEKWYIQLEAGRIREILEAYYSCMMWRNEKRVFRDAKAEFMGIIVGVDDRGRLLINTNGGERTYALKEIEFVR